MSISTFLRSRRGRLHVEQLEDRTVPTLLGNQLFPDDNPWNQPIANAPLASNSSAIINNILTRYGDGRLHPDFGQNYRTSSDLYGIPYNVVHGNSVPRVSVVIDAYADESDLLSVPIPANVVLEGDLQNGPRVGVNNRGDSHLLIYDVDNNIAYEFYRASRPSENADGKWHADQQSVWDMKTNTFRTLGYTSADAAGLAILPGLVRPDEGLPVSQGGQGVINHAIRFTLQNAIILDQFLYPASHTANPGNTNAAIQPPMGARFRLKSTFDVSTLNPQSRVIAQAMKDYGMIVADNGSNFFFSGASSSVDASNGLTLTWDDDDIQDSLRGLKSLHFSDFEVVDLTPRVTRLSATSGAPGSSITVVGQNFAGAAGRLQVFFDTTAATSVTYIDDGHLLVGVPNGTGTVDVRVQSGLTTPANADNIKSTIFGYGVSALTSADRFTFGTDTPTNQAPTVAAPAATTPNPVAGTTTTLSILGADDGGAANLMYTWTSSGPAPVLYSANGTNAASTSVVTFTMSGTYNFTATITDAGGLSVTSSTSVAVTVPPPPNQPPTVATAATATPSVVTTRTTTLSVLGADDGGAANLRYTWSVLSAPDGAPLPTFSRNGTNAASTTVATFSRAGTYLFQVTIADLAGLTATSTVSVIVQQKLTSIAVTPATARIRVRTQMQFAAVARDQFGQDLAVQPPFIWRLNGKGSITSTGLYTAPKTAGGPYVVSASFNGIRGTASVTVTR